MMHRLKVGIVGLGRGKHFYKNFNKFKDQVEITAIADINESAVLDFQKEHDVQHAFTDYEEMLDSGIDIAVIATPFEFHAEQSILALQKGIHVLSEVTAAITVEESKALVEAAKDSSAQYMMAENYCFIKENVAVKNMVEAGLFGDVYYAEGEYLHNILDYLYDSDGKPTWRVKDTIEKAGVTYGTHSLGPIMDWFGERIERVNCIGSGPHTLEQTKSNDTTLMLCQTESGKLINIRLDIISKRPHNMAYYTLQGTKGVYEAPSVPGGEHRVWLEDFSEDPETWLPLSDFYEDFLPDEYINMPEEAKDAGHWGADYFMIQAFIKSIREETPVPIDVYQSLEYTLPGILSEQSITQEGQPVEIPDVRTW